MTDEMFYGGAATRPPDWDRPKLPVAQREEIRRRYQAGETARSLAREFGVSVSAIQRYGGKRS